MNRRAEARTSVAKALDLLALVGQLSHREGVRLRDLIEPSGLSKPTTFRLLSELESLGFVEQDRETKRYRLGQKIHVLSAYHQNGTDLRQRALPLLRQLSEATGLASHLAVREGLEIVYIDKVESKAPIRIASGVGWRAPLYCTSLGKVMLAFSDMSLVDAAIAAGLDRRTEYTITSPTRLAAELEAIRTRGYAVDDRENELDVRCIAGPVFGPYHDVAAAISISGLVRQVSKRNIESLAKAVRASCSGLAADLGFVSSGTGRSPAT